MMTVTRPPIELLQIEDDLGHARLMEALLQDGGGEFHVRTERRLNDGLRAVAANNVELVLLDLGLPDSRGDETLEAMLPYAQQLPIVVMSGLADDQLAIEAVQRGFQDYIVKGELPPPQLVRRLRYALGRHGSQRDLKDRALRDELTGLYNRGAFLEFLEQQLRISSRNARNFVLCYLDVDDFKAINDRHGHHAGDQALIDVAAVLGETFRSSDIIARLGGDEFAVLAVEGSDAGVDAVRRRLQAHLTELCEARARPYRIRASVGLASSAGLDSSAQLLAAADADMYEAKRATREARGPGEAA